MEGWKSPFKHESEIIQPGYHRLYLDRYHTWVEYTATDRVAFYRLNYTKGDTAKLLVDVGSVLGNCSMNKARLHRLSDTCILGEFVTTDRFWGGPDNIPLFFVLECNRPFLSADGWNETGILPDAEPGRRRRGRHGAEFRPERFQRSNVQDRHVLYKHGECGRQPAGGTRRMGFRRCTPGNPRDLERHSGPNRGRGRQRCPTDQVLHRSVACAAGSPQNQRRERLVPRLCGRTLRGKTFGRSDETSSCAARRKRHAEVPVCMASTASG